jgi:hypothetical protein
MISLNRYVKVLSTYSKILQGGIYGIKNSPSNVSSHEYIKTLLYVNPLPNPVVYDIHRISPDILLDPITHIPLLEDTCLGIRTKMIVWAPGSESDIHHHNNEDCFFQPMYPNLSQTIYIKNENPITLMLHDNEFTYISDLIGPHSMKYMPDKSSKCNVSFHLYVRDDAFEDEIYNEHSRTSSCMNSDPDLYWYVNERE